MKNEDEILMWRVVWQDGFGIMSTFEFGTKAWAAEKRKKVGWCNMHGDVLVAVDEL